MASDVDLHGEIPPAPPVVFRNVIEDNQGREVAWTMGDDTLRELLFLAAGKGVEFDIHGTMQALKMAAAETEQALTDQTITPDESE